MLLSRIVGLFFNRTIKTEKGGAFLGRKVSFDSLTQFEGGNRISSRTSLSNCFIGYGTNIGNSSCFVNCKIGRYTSIGARVIIIRGKHPLSYVSTHPAFYSLKKQVGFTYVTEQKFEEFEVPKYDDVYATSIGNDVWIGSDVKLLEGVNVGNGAVIAAGAVVCKDIEPYSVYGGVPAKLIKYRFSQSVIDKLQSLEWWNKSESWIKDNADSFDNIDLFLSKNA